MSVLHTQRTVTGNMNENKLNELNTLLDGIKYAVEDARNSIKYLEEQAECIRDIINDKEKEF